MTNNAVQGEDADITRAKCEITDAVSVLLDQAWQYGAVRPSLNGGDVLTLLCGLQHVITNRPDQTTAAERYPRVLDLGLPDHPDV